MDIILGIRRAWREHVFRLDNQILALCHQLRDLYLLESINTGRQCMEIADLYLWTVVRLLGRLSSDGRFARCQIFLRMSKSAWGKLCFFFLSFFETSDVRWKVQNKSGLQVCVQPRAFLCTQAEWCSQRAGRWQRESAPAACSCKQQHAGLLPLLENIRSMCVCVLALQEESVAFKPMQTDRNRHSATGAGGGGNKCVSFCSPHYSP